VPRRHAASRPGCPSRRRRHWPPFGAVEFVIYRRFQPPGTRSAANGWHRRVSPVWDVFQQRSPNSTRAVANPDFTEVRRRQDKLPLHWRDPLSQYCRQQDLVLLGRPVAPKPWREARGEVRVRLGRKVLLPPGPLRETWIGPMASIRQPLTLSPSVRISGLASLTAKIAMWRPGAVTIPVSRLSERSVLAARRRWRSAAGAACC
jgi:hypothetical protein